MNNYKILSCNHLRLQELGFVPGTDLEIVQKSWFGIVVKIRGAMIGLRKKDFEKLILERIEK